VGWLKVRTVQEVPAGDHTLFVGDVLAVEPGTARDSLVYRNRHYLPL
jgi:flavin reductase (DIM6/NTAB) family NADH-FMN oxidoreductase RutF